MSVVGTGWNNFWNRIVVGYTSFAGNALEEASEEVDTSQVEGSRGSVIVGPVQVQG